jgi:hypothetical protein
LPRQFRLAGWVLLVPALFAAVLRFHFGLKPKVLECTVFAVYSSYFETRYFAFVQNNMAEEIAGVLLLLGLFFVGFSRERREDCRVDELRFRSLLLAVYINSALTLLSLLFVFGLGFVQVLIANLFTALVFYIAIFRYSCRQRPIGPPDSSAPRS